MKKLIQPLPEDGKEYFCNIGEMFSASTEKEHIKYDIKAIKVLIKIVGEDTLKKEFGYDYEEMMFRWNKYLKNLDKIEGLEKDFDKTLEKSNNFQGYEKKINRIVRLKTKLDEEIRIILSQRLLELTTLKDEEEAFEKIPLKMNLMKVINAESKKERQDRMNFLRANLGLGGINELTIEKIMDKLKEELKNKNK